MLGSEFINNAEWEVYPFVQPNPLVGALVDAAITVRSRYKVYINSVTLTLGLPDVTFTFEDIETGATTSFDTASATSKNHKTYGDYTMLKARFSSTNIRAAVVFLFHTESMADVSGLNELVTAKANVIQEEAVFSINGFSNVVELLGQAGIRVELGENNRVELSRDDTNPCPENCPPIPLLTINSQFAGFKNVPVVGNCNNAVQDNDNHILYLANQCQPCCDCDQQAHIHEAIVKTYEYYNSLVDELTQVSEDYNAIRSKLIDDATAAGDTLKVQEIQKYMPDNLFRLK